MPEMRFPPNEDEDETLQLLITNRKIKEALKPSKGVQSLERITSPRHIHRISPSKVKESKMRERSAGRVEAWERITPRREIFGEGGGENNTLV